MAKEEKRESKIDSDLELDDLDFDNLDSELNLDEVSLNREPSFTETSKELAKSGAAGFIQTLSEKVADKALPEAYTSEYYTVIDYADLFKDLLNQNKSKIEKSLYYLGKEVKKILPFQVNILDRFLENIESKREQIVQQNEEQVREATIQSSLNSIFEKQLEIQKNIQAKEEAEHKAERKQDLALTKLNLDLLRSIDENVANSTAFTLQIGKEYYKKSLEIQYKSYFVQLDMLKIMRDYYKGFSVQLDNVVKNTGLPDYVKLTRSEKISDVIKTATIESIYKNIFSNSSYIQEVKKNFSNYINSKVSDLVSKIDNVTNALSQIGMVKEMGGNTLSLSGSILTSYLGSKLGEKVSEKIPPTVIEKIKGNRYLNIGANYLTLLSNSPSTFFKILKDKVLKKEEEYVAKDTIFGNLMYRSLGGISDILGIATKKLPEFEIKPESILEHDKPAIFDKKVHRSITEIIPLYLSKIHYELLALRQGYYKVHKKLELPEEDKVSLHYNFVDRKLDTIDNVRRGIRDYVFKEVDRKKQKLEAVSSNIIHQARINADKNNKLKLDNKLLQKSFNEYLKKASEKISSNEFTYENLILNYDKNEKLRDILTNDVKEYINAIKVSIENSKQKEETIKFLNSQLKDSGNIFPIYPIKELFSKTSSIAGFNVPNSLDNNEANIIAKALSNYIIFKREDITIDSIVRASCFSRMNAKDFDVVKDKLSIFISEVKKIVDSEDSLRISSLELLIGMVNTALKNNFNIDPSVFKKLYNYSPLLQEKGKLSVENLIETKLGIFRDAGYISNEQIRELRRTTSKEHKELKTKILKKNILDKIESSNYIKNMEETIKEFRKTIEGSSSVKDYLNAFIRLTNDIVAESRKITNKLFTENTNILDKISNKIENLVDKGGKILISEIIEQTNNFIKTLDDTIVKLEQNNLKFEKSLEETNKISKETVDNVNVRNRLEKAHKLLHRKTELEIRALRKIRERTVYLHNTISNYRDSDISDILTNIKNEIFKLIKDYKEISDRLNSEINASSSST